MVWVSNESERRDGQIDRQRWSPSLSGKGGWAALGEGWRNARAISGIIPSLPNVDTAYAEGSTDGAEVSLLAEGAVSWTPALLRFQVGDGAPVADSARSARVSPHAEI